MNDTMLEKKNATTVETLRLTQKPYLFACRALISVSPPRGRLRGKRSTSNGEGEVHRADAKRTARGQ